MKSGLILLALLAALVSAIFALPRTQSAQGLLISDAIARPLDTGQAAAFFTVENRGEPDRLISITSPVARASLYTPVSPKGVPVPQGTASLALDAAHIKLDGLAHTVEHGSLLPVTLTFANAGVVTTKLRLSDPTKLGAAEEVGLFGIGDICVVGDGEPAPSISLSVLETAKGYEVRVNTDDFSFSEALTGLYHVPGMGHGHIYVGGMKLGRIYDPVAHVGKLPKGTHEVRVTLNTNDHRAYVVNDVPVTASAMIVVD
ncbi:MAG: copper chaperone PCu(A)C [Aliishimia sp.]